ncbi:hypothetical protein GCM10027299_56180 [Larkinella ripae]
MRTLTLTEQLSVELVARQRRALKATQANTHTWVEDLCNLCDTFGLFADQPPAEVVSYAYSLARTFFDHYLTHLSPCKRPFWQMILVALMLKSAGRYRECFRYHMKHGDKLVSEGPRCVPYSLNYN